MAFQIGSQICPFLESGKFEGCSTVGSAAATWPVNVTMERGYG